MRVSSDSRYSGSGSRTRGWNAPRRGKPRHAMMKKCGEKCFLDPEHEAFPICAKLTGGKSDCQLDCRGVQAAFQRARQWGYEDVAKAAKELSREKCRRK